MNYKKKCSKLLVIGLCAGKTFRLSSRKPLEYLLTSCPKHSCILSYNKTILINSYLICLPNRLEKSSSIKECNLYENTRSKSASVEKSTNIYMNEDNNDFFDGYEVPIKLRNEDLSSEAIYVEMENNYCVL